MKRPDIKNIWIGILILIAIVLTISLYTWPTSIIVTYILFFLGACWAYIIPVFLITVLARYFTKVNKPWNIEDKLILAIPFIVWATFFFVWSSNKSLSNIGVEPFLLGCSMILSPIAKYLLGSRINEKRLSLFMIFLISLVGIGIWLWMPPLPE